MLFSPLLSSLAIAACVSAQAHYLANELSFGHTDKISPNHIGIPHFYVTGKPASPQILSNKVILTPPYPGNQRGAIWAEKPLHSPKWDAVMDFRVSGPERGGGRLQLWLTKNGRADIGTSGVYTVGKFDGLVIVIDTYGGTGGFIRAFLNDGSTTYSTHHAVDSLAFGHCPYAYRNRGHPSTLTVEQDWHNFKVLIDGALCFETSSVRIPSDYYFGITAQSSELPDSIEVNKLVITTDTAEPGYPYSMDGSGAADPLHNNAHHAAAKDASEDDSIDRLVQQKMHQNHGSPDYLKQDTPGDELPDLPASAIDTDRQFADLHYRLQALSHVITTLSAGVFNARDLSDAHHTDLSTSILELKHTLGAMAERLSTLEVSVHDLRRDSAEGISSVKTVIEDLRREVIHSHSSVLMGVKAHQEGMLEGVKEHMPGYGRFVMWVLLVQVAVGGAYVAYKRRRKAKGNKYL